MKVSELMHTPPVVCTTKQNLGEVARLMDARGVGCVMVLDEIRQLAGVVTDRDLAIRGIGAGRSADIGIVEVMSRDVATVDPHAAVETAAVIMQKRGIRRVPVVDDDGRLHGMITVDDLVRHLGDEADALTDTLRAQQLLA